MLRRTTFGSGGHVVFILILLAERHRGCQEERGAFFPGVGRPLRNLPPLFSRQLGSSHLPALLSAKTPRGDGVGIPLAGRLFERFAGRLLYNGSGKAVQVTGVLLA